MEVNLVRNETYQVQQAAENVQPEKVRIQEPQVQQQTQSVSVPQQEQPQDRALQTSQEQMPSPEDEKYQNVMAEKAVENANNRIRNMHTDAKFSFNKDINRITITITDRDSKEVIREIPSEETQKMLERLHTLTGVMVDEEV